MSVLSISPPLRCGRARAWLLVLPWLPLSAAAQDLTNTGSVLTVTSGAVFYVGAGGLRNQASGTLTNAGTLRIEGQLTNAGTLDLSTGALEVRGDVTNAGSLLPGTSAVTFSGPADQLLTPGGATLYQVLVNKPTAGANTLRLAGNLTVSNLLTLGAGVITTQASSGPVYTLRLPAGASLSGEASGRYVLGSLAVTRPVGSGAAVDFGHGASLDPQGNSLGLVTITRTAGLQTADLSYGQAVGGSAKGIDRLYTVAPGTQPSSPVQLTLSWLPDNDNGLPDFTQAQGWQQPAAGQPWTPAGPVANGSGRRLLLTPSVLNRFTVSNVANPLPVTLLDFTAQAEGPSAVRLRWATASELRSASFTGERSLDGCAFTAVGSLPAAGTSVARREYALLDAQLPAGATLLYYRLRQTDIDGTVTYSPVRTVALTPEAAGFVVYPTRVVGGQVAHYHYTGPAGPATLLVFDLVGRPVRQLAVAGGPQGEGSLAGLASGAYLLRYTTATASFTGRCVVE